MTSGTPVVRYLRRKIVVYCMQIKAFSSTAIASMVDVCHGLEYVVALLNKRT